MDSHAIVAALRAELLEESRVTWAYLFGSFVRGAPFRDLDVAIMVTPDARWTALDAGRLRLRLERASEHDVDLVHLRSAPLPLLGSILDTRLVVLDREPDERHVWEAETAARWLDFRPALQWTSALRREAVRRRLEAKG